MQCAKAARRNALASTLVGKNCALDGDSSYWLQLLTIEGRKA